MPCGVGLHGRDVVASLRTTHGGAEEGSVVPPLSRRAQTHSNAAGRCPSLETLCSSQGWHVRCVFPDSAQGTGPLRNAASMSMHRWWEDAKSTRERHRWSPVKSTNMNSEEMSLIPLYGLSSRYVENKLQLGECCKLLTRKGFPADMYLFWLHLEIYGITLFITQNFGFSGDHNMLNSIRVYVSFFRLLQN